ncbi:MAG: ABC transporter ATP-binding protein [Firmicutes bacterium]|nr:ABC transporter ATP-binding protein [Bacillota bacterium]
MNTEGLLEVAGLTKSFMGLQAVNDLTFSVPRGRVVGLIGPNGAGKTTVFNLITRVLRADRGSVRLDGRELTSLPPHEVNKCGVARTFQNIRLFPGFSVLENVLWTLSTRAQYGLVQSILAAPAVRAEEKRVLEEACELLKTAGLYDRRFDKARTLSYGDQRRLELVRALATKPRLLLLDEPTAGMNPTETSGFADHLRYLNAEGTTILLIEHDMRFVMGLSDKVIVLNHGSKIAEGIPAEVRVNEAVISAYLGRAKNAAG